MTDLGTFGGSESKAYGINDNGQVVGYAYNTNALWHAFLYSGGNMTDLGTLPGGWVSKAHHINNNGQVVGFADTPDYSNHAFRYSGGIMIDLGTLGGSNSRAYSINDNGQVAGEAITSSFWRHPFLYTAGSMNDLGALDDRYLSGEALGINNSGQLVGYAYTGVEDRAFLYTDGGMTNLNRLIPAPGWTLERAYAINDSGQIVANGFIGPAVGALLLTPLPALAINHSGATLLLSWPANATTFRLLQNTGLVSSSWVPVTNRPTTTNDKTQVVISGPLTGSRVLSAPVSVNLLLNHRAALDAAQTCS